MPPRIDYDRCTGCGTCIDLCSLDVFFGTKGFGTTEGAKPDVTYPEFCWHCNWCVVNCPEEAVSLKIPLPMHVPYK